MAHLMQRIAVVIEDGPSLGIHDMGALTPFQRVQARRGEGLVQEHGGVFVQQGAGIPIQVFGLPATAGVGKVEVAFGSEVAMVFVFLHGQGIHRARYEICYQARASYLYNVKWRQARAMRAGIDRVPQCRNCELKGNYSCFLHIGVPPCLHFDDGRAT